VALKVLVCVKTIEQLSDEFELTPDGREVVRERLETATNEWDLAATEEALRMREEFGGEVVILTCGDAATELGLRRALAMGADRGVRVESSARDPLSIAYALAPVVAAEQPDLVFCGVQSADSVQGATGTMLATLAGLPCAAVVRRIQYNETRRRAVIERELEGGRIARMEVHPPAVFTIQTGINRPRHANLRAIKRADAAEVKVFQAVPPPSRAYVVRRMFAPAAGGHAEFLEGDAASIARHLAGIVRERLG
jgi:electron transfer flavoprotein beta subunit